jgi:hypothetical protein
MEPIDEFTAQTDFLSSSEKKVNGFGFTARKKCPAEIFL